MTINGVATSALLDSGNNFRTAISEAFAAQLGLGPHQLVPLPHPVSLKTADDSSSLEVLGETPHALHVKAKSEAFTIRPIVVRGLRAAVNISGVLLGWLHWSMDYAKGHVVTSDGKRLRLSHAPEAEAELSFIKAHLHIPGKGPVSPNMMWPRVYNARVQNSVKCPPRAVTKVLVDVSLPEGAELKTWLLRGSSRTANCTQLLPVRNALVKCQPGARNLLIGNVLNLGNRAIHLKAGTHFGRVEEVAPLDDTPALQAMSLQVDQMQQFREPEPEEEASSEEKFPMELGDKAKTMSESEKRKWLIGAFQLDKSPFLQDKKELKKAVDCLLSFWDVFSHNGEHGRTHLVQHRIQLKEGTQPIKDKQRQFAPPMEEKLEQQVKDWAKKGIIEPSQSPWAANMVSVLKSDGRVRWCTDFRRLNAATVPDSFPVPHVKTTLGRLAGSKIFSVFDLAGAFHAVPIHPEDRPLTAFFANSAQWQYRLMGFGLINGPATYCRLVEQVLKDVPYDMAVPYLDDAVCHGRDIDTHIKALKTTLAAYHNAGLKLAPKKCQFFREEIKFLGHKLSEQGLQPTESYKAAVQRVPCPKTKSEARSFLGLVGYYRDSIPDFASLAKPWTSVSGKLQGPEGKEAERTPLKVTPEMEASFQELKRRLCEAPVLGFAYFSGPKAGRFTLDTDFRKEQIAGILSQEQEGKEVVIAYGSHALNKAQSNYSATKGELFAGYYYMKHFRYYLQCNGVFRWRTDHSALTHWYTSKELSDTISRWLEELANFTFEVQHRSGVLHTNADSLSRLAGAAVPADPQLYPKALQQLQVLHGLVEKSPEWRDRLLLGNVGITRAMLAPAQRTEPDLSRVAQWVRKKHLPTKEEVRLLGDDGRALCSRFKQLFMDKDGILRIRLTDQTGPHGYVPECVVLPRCYVYPVVKAAHQVVAHLGLDKTMEFVRRRIFFPNMRNRMKDIIRACDVCQKKATPAKAQRHTPKMAPSLGPFRRMHIDIVGPYGEGEITGSKYLLSMRDAFSRWPDAQPLKEQTAQAICEALERMLCFYGVPEELYSDNAAVFNSALFKQLQEKYQFKALRTTSYHPQGNAVVERLHRDLNGCIKATASETGQNWERILPHCLWALRTIRCDSIRMTPYRILFGHEAPTQLHNIFGGPRDLSSIATSSTAQYGLELEERMIKAQRWVMEKLPAVVARRKRQYVKVPPNLDVGSRVLLSTPQVTRHVPKKIHNFWTGPWKVTEILEYPVLLRIEPHEDWEFGMERYKEQVVAIDRLKPYVGSEQFDQEWLHDSQLAMQDDPEALGPFDNGIESDDEITRKPFPKRSWSPPDSSSTDSDSDDDDADYGDYYPDGNCEPIPDSLADDYMPQPPRSRQNVPKKPRLAAETQTSSTSSAASTASADSATSVPSLPPTPAPRASFGRPMRSGRLPARLRGDDVLAGTQYRDVLRDEVGSSTDSQPSCEPDGGSS